MIKISGKQHQQKVESLFDYKYPERVVVVVVAAAVVVVVVLNPKLPKPKP